MLMDVHQRGNLRFPQSLPEFQRLFPDDAACAAYLEKARWSDGFVCPHCQAAGEPFRFANRPGVLRCRKCRRDTGLTVGTVMARSHTPLSVWFWVTAQVGDLVQNRRREFARDVGSPVRASMMAQPCFLAVDRNERMSAKSMAPSIERNPPEIFWRNFIMRPSRSA